LNRSRAIRVKQTGMQRQQIEIDADERIEVAPTESRRRAKRLEAVDGWWPSLIDAAEDAGVQMVLTIGVLHATPGDDVVDRRQAAASEQIPKNSRRRCWLCFPNISRARETAA